MKGGVFLSDFSSEHFYKIQSVSRSDAGDYRCFAKNSVGTIISEKIKLTVACKLFSKKLVKYIESRIVLCDLTKKKVSSYHCVKMPEAKEIEIIHRLFLVIAMFCQASSSQFNESLNLPRC